MYLSARYIWHFHLYLLQQGTQRWFKTTLLLQVGLGAFNRLNIFTFHLKNFNDMYP